MERTLEEWFVELDRLLAARDTLAQWTLRRLGSAAFELRIGEKSFAGPSVAGVVRAGCAYILDGARRVMQAQ